MDGGQVAAEGTHVSLLERSPLYTPKCLNSMSSLSRKRTTRTLTIYRLERERRKWYQVLIIIFEGSVY